MDNTPELLARANEDSRNSGKEVSIRQDANDADESVVLPVSVLIVRVSAVLASLRG